MKKALKIILIILAIPFIIGIVWSIYSAITGKEPEYGQLGYEESNKAQGTPEQRQAVCANVGEFSDPVPYSTHLVIHYVRTNDTCYRKEPDLAPKTSTISIQKLDGAKITPIFRIIYQYDYTPAYWADYKSQLKKQHGSDYSDISAESIPLFSLNLKKQIQFGEAVKITNWPERNHVSYYFTDREGMLYYVQNEPLADGAKVYIDYK